MEYNSKNTNNRKKIWKTLILHNCLPLGNHARFTSKKVTQYLLGSRNDYNLFKFNEMKHLLLKFTPLIDSLFRSKLVLNKRCGLRKTWKSINPIPPKDPAAYADWYESMKNIKIIRRFNRFYYKTTEKKRPVKILFASTNPMFAGIIEEAAMICQMSAKTNRWMCGYITANTQTLAQKYTNLKIIENLPARTKLEKQFEKTFSDNKEAKQKRYQWHNLNSINQRPALAIIPDIENNDMILRETFAKDIPVIGLINSDQTTEIAYPIFGNSTSVKTVHFFCHFLSLLIAKSFVEQEYKQASHRIFNRTRAFYVRTKKRKIKFHSVDVYSKSNIVGHQHIYPNRHAGTKRIRTIPIAPKNRTRKFLIKNLSNITKFKLNLKKPSKTYRKFNSIGRTPYWRNIKIMATALRLKLRRDIEHNIKPQKSLQVKNIISNSNRFKSIKSKYRNNIKKAKEFALLRKEQVSKKVKQLRRKNKPVTLRKSKVNTSQSVLSINPSKKKAQASKFVFLGQSSQSSKTIKVKTNEGIWRTNSSDWKRKHKDKIIVAIDFDKFDNKKESVRLFNQQYLRLQQLISDRARFDELAQIGRDYNEFMDVYFNNKKAIELAKQQKDVIDFIYAFFPNPDATIAELNLFPSENKIVSVSSVSSVFSVNRSEDNQSKTKVKTKVHAKVNAKANMSKSKVVAKESQKKNKKESPLVSKEVNNSVYIKTKARNLARAAKNEKILKENYNNFVKKVKARALRNSINIINRKRLSLKKAKLHQAKLRKAKLLQPTYNKNNKKHINVEDDDILIMISSKLLAQARTLSSDVEIRDRIRRFNSIFDNREKRLRNRQRLEIAHKERRDAMLASLARRQVLVNHSMKKLNLSFKRLTRRSRMIQKKRTDRNFKKPGIKRKYNPQFKLKKKKNKRWLFNKALGHKFVARKYRRDLMQTSGKYINGNSTWAFIKARKVNKFKYHIAKIKRFAEKLKNFPEPTISLPVLTSQVKGKQKKTKLKFRGITVAEKLDFKERLITIVKGIKNYQSIKTKLYSQFSPKKRFIKLLESKKLLGSLLKNYPYATRLFFDLNPIKRKNITKKTARKTTKTVLYSELTNYKKNPYKFNFRRFVRNKNIAHNLIWENLYFNSWVKKTTKKRFLERPARFWLESKVQFAGKVRKHRTNKRYFFRRLKRWHKAHNVIAAVIKIRKSKTTYPRKIERKRSKTIRYFQWRSRKFRLKIKRLHQLFLRIAPRIRKWDPHYRKNYRTKLRNRSRFSHRAKKSSFRSTSRVKSKNKVFKENSYPSKSVSSVNRSEDNRSNLTKKEKQNFNKRKKK